MKDKNNLKFRISSALKNIIGKELITDQYIAVFELVKNSFDAYATEVEIIFKDIHGTNPTLIIKDNGKGMNYDDLKDKWLFVAYSAKREGTEDQNYDYRDKIKGARVFAGAKGIGRFSCDRLGSNLRLTTIKREENPKIEGLVIGWDKYEEDSKKEFMEIDFDHINPHENEYKLKHGTVLEITNLRDKWTREELLQLKFSLEKLVNPNQEKESENFSIILSVKEEVQNDKEADEDRNKVNGKVKNYLFETLGTKTTQVRTKIIDNGEVIKTTLIDRGVEIYTILEKNNYELLKNTKLDIDFNLFYLNRSAKINFKKIMGIDAVKYGSVFLYKNGFRIYPFGEEGEDSLRIDRRKQQGYARNLGTREIIGQIEINGENDQLKETSSRDGGLIKTREYDELIECFHDNCFKRLERYVVEVIKWGEPFIDENTKKEVQLLPSTIKKDSKAKAKMLELILSLTNAKNVIDIIYDKNFLGIIEENQERSASKLAKNFERMAEETGNPQLVKEAKKIRIQLNQLKRAKEEAEEETKSVKEEIIEKEQELEQKTQQLRIVTAISSQDLENVTNLHHQVLVSTDVISTEMLLFSRWVDNEEKITKNDIKDFLNKISFEIMKIDSISKFGTRAIFENFTDIQEADIINFIENYVDKISNFFSASNLKVSFKTSVNASFLTFFRPLDISIIIDNMISNSKKAGASFLSIGIEHVSDKSINIFFKDNGKGVNKTIKEIDHIFEKGFSTTKSTGLGLFHVKNIATDYKWTISINKEIQKGFEFILTVKK